MTLSKKNIKGFSLIELMVVILIIAIISAFGLPALMTSYRNFKLKGTVQDLYSAFQKAKMEAIRRNTNVTILFNPGTYSPDGMVGSYIVFIDDGAGTLSNADNHLYDSPEEIIISESMPKSVSLYETTFSGSIEYGEYNTRGLPTRLGKIRLRNSERFYQLTIEVAGNIRIEIRNDGTWP